MSWIDEPPFLEDQPEKKNNIEMDEISQNAVDYVLEAMAILSTTIEIDVETDETKPSTNEATQTARGKADGKTDEYSLSLIEGHMLSINDSNLRKVEFDSKDINTCQFFKDIHYFWPRLSGIQTGFMQLTPELKIRKLPDGEIRIDSDNPRPNAISQYYSLTLREFIEDNGCSVFEAAFDRKVRLRSPGEKPIDYVYYIYFHQNGQIQIHTGMPPQHDAMAVEQANILAEHGSTLIAIVVNFIKKLSTP